jgi:hypothetical protein
LGDLSREFFEPSLPDDTDRNGVTNQISEHELSAVGGELEECDDRGASRIEERPSDTGLERDQSEGELKSEAPTDHSPRDLRAVDA